MKYTIYLRVAKTTGRKGYKVSAASVPNNEPLNNGQLSYRNGEFYPTVAFAVNVDIPDEMFNQAARVIADLNVAMKEAQVTTEIILPKGISIKKKK